MVNCYVDGCMTLTATTYLKLMHSYEKCLFLTLYLYLAGDPFLDPLKDIGTLKF